MTCYMLKFMNGDTILASIVSKDDTHVYINNPVKLNFSATEMGSMMSSSAWIPLSEMVNMIPIKNDHVLVMVRAGDKLGEYYERAVHAFVSPEPEHIDDDAYPDENVISQRREEIKNKMVLVRAAAANTVH